MAFSKQQLQKFAHLIRIDVSDEKLSEMKVDSIIEWLDKVQKIDTKGVEPMLSPAEHGLPMRDDVVTDGGCRDEVLANAPDKSGVQSGYFAVPKIINEE
ncbi:MAG: Asp-tRNA(Asn)/Glu-tRNA(Gln) amidotransferase subunit GatC [Rickettsiales bacterium]|jgi:aspartyl-tRNA(Asn)/glutamyl-tRNA(Gln) amidotransferase subunit C|nr:Asp-tRNA(Asn)/Glu-tRNA(Gln) amidotransferase subunit GatC [Rickettsiales bacterium]